MFYAHQGSTCNLFALNLLEVLLNAGASRHNQHFLFVKLKLAPDILGDQLQIVLDVIKKIFLLDAINRINNDRYCCAIHIRRLFFSLTDKDCQGNFTAHIYGVRRMDEKLSPLVSIINLVSSLPLIRGNSTGLILNKVVVHHYYLGAFNIVKVIGSCLY